MAYVRKQTVKGKVYYQLVESFRKDGKVRKKILCSLGGYPSVEDALHAAKQHGDDERVRQLETVGTKDYIGAEVVGTNDVGIIGGVGTKDVEAKAVGTKPERKRTRFPTLPQLSPAGNLTRRRRLLVKRIPGGPRVL